jgi:XTP/dITP diphosphohydrolase
LADDSGIEIEALDGAPGVYTADWAETDKGRDFTMAMTRAYDELTEKSAPQPWRARFCSTLVLTWPDGHEEVFSGAMNGQLVWPLRGTLGHGYDPMFQPDGHDITFAEMSPETKNQISHRRVAFDLLIAGCFA